MIHGLSWFILLASIFVQVLTDGDTEGVIFSATTLNYLNNCTIIKLCENKVPVIVYLPMDNISQQKIISTYGCPKIIYLPYVSPAKIQKPTITSISRVKPREFEHVLVHARAFKIRSIKQCPFTQTLYLDNDIDIVDLGKVLDWFDVLKSKKTVISLKNDHTVHHGHDYNVRHTVHERNSGVMYLMCKSSLVEQILEHWEYAYFHHAAFDHHDQGPLIVTLSKYYEHHESILDLPENYNCRYDLYEVKRSTCYINHVHETHYRKRLDPKIVGPRNCIL